MKIKYDFVDGTCNEIDVEESIGKVLLEMDRDTYNSNRRETRRQTSIDYLEGKGLQFSDGTDLLEDILGEEDIALLFEAISRLTPYQRELIDALYLTDKTVSHAEYAKARGITETSVTQQAWRARERLKQFLRK